MAGKIAGCAQVIAVDIHDSRLELAKELGATGTINTSKQKLAEAVLELTGARGADFIVDTTARPELLEQAVDALAIRGTLALVGAAAPGTTTTFEIGASLVKGWTFKTVIQGSSVPQVFIPRLIQLWQRGQFPFDKLIKHYSLAEINQGFEDSKKGITVKPVVVH
jgi:aryl-alcohol dehydrogenase